jgi:hypothetical protein
MSKNNQPQAAAPKATTDKTAPTKAVVSKVLTTKPVEAKAPTTKAIAAKPVAKSSVIPAKATPKKVVLVKATKPVVKLSTKADAKEKTPKLKMERDSFTMPKAEYAQLNVLKERLAKLGNPVKKSELLRAGVMQLTAMTDAALKAAMSKVPTIKTGRPKKK